MNRTSTRYLFVPILTAVFGAFAPNVWAACTSPHGEAGAVVFASPQNILAYCDGTNWISMAGFLSGGGAGATLLNELTDVTISGASSGQVLTYNGSIWVNGAAQDARIGTLTNTKWCTSDGSSIVCEADPPLTSVPELDRIVSGTASVIAYEDSHVSSSVNLHISGTVTVAGTGSETCDADRYGTIRYIAATGELEVCRP